MVKCPDKHNLREKAFVLAYSSREKQPIIAEKTQQQSGRQGQEASWSCASLSRKLEQEVRLGIL